MIDDDFKNKSREEFSDLFLLIEKEISKSSNEKYVELLKNFSSICQECLEKNLIPTRSCVYRLEGLIKSHNIGELRTEIIEFKKLLISKY